MTSLPLATAPTPSPTPRLRDLLLVRQGVVTLCVALLSTLVISLWVLTDQWRQERVAVALNAAQDLALVKGAAAEAAFQLSSDLSNRVTQAMADNTSTLTEAVLEDNFGTVLAQARNPVKPLALAAWTGFSSLAEDLFAGDTEFSTDLRATALDGATSTVGKLTIRLDPNALVRQFVSRISSVLIFGAVQVAILCVVVAAIFHHLITRPLLTLTRAVAAVDPGRPGGTPVPIPKGHANDELGVLSQTLNRLLKRSQENLDGRDQAEAALSALARDLEHRVRLRTHDLEKANHSIHDGIRYAARLQKALLPASTALDGIVTGWTVGWQPLDGVGGDFYWVGRFGDLGVIALMDCTGHGVPGAFMSAVAASVLNRVVNHIGHDDPAEILAHINKLMKSALHQDGDGTGHSNDGLDAAICVIDPNRRSVHFSGAGLALVSVGPAGTKVVRGDRASLGYPDSPTDMVFTRHTLTYVPGETFYLYTDGVTDQIGGSSRRLMGKRRLHELLAANHTLALDAQRDALFDGLAAWRGDQHRRDDMTWLAFRPVVVGF